MYHMKKSLFDRRNFFMQQSVNFTCVYPRGAAAGERRSSTKSPLKRGTFSPYLWIVSLEMFLLWIQDNWSWDKKIFLPLFLIIYHIYVVNFWYFDSLHQDPCCHKAILRMHICQQKNKMPFIWFLKESLLKWLTLNIIVKENGN